MTLVMSEKCELASCGCRLTRPGLVIEQYGKRFCSYACLDKSNVEKT